MALWNEHAESFDAEHYMNMATQGPVVFLFVALTCGQFDGNLNLHLHIKIFSNTDLFVLLATEPHSGTLLFCEGKLSLQGSPLCKWYANPELPEVIALQDR